jgi:putative ABC transport system ATP-binding protein
MTISLSNIRYAYPDSPNNIVLDIPQWSVAAEEQVFVHGPSGSGKSTLLNL